MVSEPSVNESRVIPGELAVILVGRPGSNVGPIDLGFIARTVRIDNPTNQWWFLPAAQQWIPPYTFNIVCQLVLKSQIALVQNLAPAGQTQGAPITGQEAVFIFTERVFLPTPGVGRNDTFGVSDAVTPPTGVTPTAMFPYLYDGATWQRQRGIITTNLLPMGSRTSTQTLPDRRNWNFRGVVVLLDINTIGLGSLSVQIQGKSDTTGNYFNLLQSNAQTSNGLKVFAIVPAAFTAIAGTPTHQITEGYNGLLLTQTYRVIIVHNNANAVTYSVDLVELP